jgi:hypothetical protein
MLFAKLRVLRTFQKRHLDFLRSIEDFDLLQEVGFHQEIGQPLSMKQVYLLDVASVATVQRRLRRLKQLGVIVLKRSEGDGRSVQLTLSPKVLKTYLKYGELIGLNGRVHE